MNISSRLSLALSLAAFSLHCMPVSADMDPACRLLGSYGYVYNGTSFTPAGPLPLTETGVLTVDPNGHLGGEGALAFQFSNFSGKGPLWLLLQEVQSDGVITPSATDECRGNIEFVATATVIKTSNSAIVPEGTVLFTNAPRSIAYTVSGRRNEIVDLISTSPGTIASGTAHRRDNNIRD